MIKLLQLKNHQLALGAVLAILSALAPCQSFAQTYCTPIFTTGCTAGDRIDLFTFNTISNATSSCNTNSYSDYTNLNSLVIPGNTYGLTAQSGPMSMQGFKVWIDYNQNGSFTDPGEEVWSAMPPAGISASDTVTIPATALPGITRLRIRSNYNSLPVHPCLGQLYGEVEDYTVIIQSTIPCTVTPVAGTVPATVSACQGTSVTIAASGYTSAAGITYQWQQSADGGITWVNAIGGSGATLPTYFTPPVGNTVTPLQYRFIASCTASGLSDTSGVTTVTVSAALQCYCTSSATSGSDEEIFNVTFGSLNNSSTCTTTGGAGSVLGRYSNYTSTVTAPDVMLGQTVPFSVQNGTCGGNYTNMTTIFIDYNQNGSFSDPGEQVYLSSSAISGANTRTGNITIPPSALLGNTRMRVVTIETNFTTTISPCATYVWGETEDYTINIIPATNCSGTPVAGTLPANIAPCGLNPVTITPTGFVYATGIVYQWQQSVDGGVTWVNATGGAGATTLSYTLPPFSSIVTGTAYRLVATCSLSNQTDIAGPTSITVPPAMPVVVSNGPVCIGETLQLSAAGTWAPGVTFNWVGPNGFTSTLQNPVIPNASLANQGNYFVVVSSGGCFMQSPSAFIWLNQTPSQHYLTSNLPVCAGNALVLTVWGGTQSNYTWTGPNNVTATGNVLTITDFQPAYYGQYIVSSGTGSCFSADTIVVGAPGALSGFTNSPVCPGADIVLGVDSIWNALGFVWSGPNGFTSANQNVVIPNAGPSTAGSYSVHAVLDGCTTDTSVFQVDVSSVISVNAANNSPINQGSTLFLNGTGSAGTYTWTGPNAYYATGHNPYILNVSPVHSGDYTVSLESPGCSTATAVTSVVVNPMNIITGEVFDDINSNGLQETGENFLSGVLVTAQPGGHQAITNNLGMYFLYVPDGTFTVAATSLAINQTSNPGSHTVSVAGSNQISSGNNFGIHSDPMNNLEVWITELWTAAPGFTTKHRINYKNLAPLPASGTVRFVRDPLLVLHPGTTTGYTTAGDTLIWSFTNLMPYETLYFYVLMTVPVGTTLGTLLSSRADITPLAGDIVPANNTYTLTQVVTGSWDPNDKAVQPAGPITLQDIATGQELVYTVRFQNTGTAPAINVLITDTLSSNLDLSTFKMLSSSHNYNLTMIEGRILEWHFPNIMLPDSNSNEPASHGDVQYSIRPKSTLVVGDQIENTAHIFFDFNEAVVTNTTLTAVGVLNVPKDFDVTTLQLYPNPNHGSFTVKLKDCQPGKLQIRLVNMLGQEVYTKAATAKNSAFEDQISLQNLPEGMYLLQVRQGEKVYTTRVIIQK